MFKKSFILATGYILPFLRLGESSVESHNIPIAIALNNTPRVYTDFLLIVSAVLLVSCGSKMSPADTLEMNNKMLNAVLLGNELQVKSWLHDGADLNARFQNKSKKTALIVAVEKGHSEIATLLLDRGADPNLTDAFQNSALLYAADRGSSAMIESLVNKGAALEAKDFRGNTALIIATSNGKIAAVSVLLDKGSDPNGRNTYGRTSLMIAAELGNEPVVRMLLDRKADTNLKDNNQDTAYAIASKSGNTKIMQLLPENSSSAK